MTLNDISFFIVRYLDDINWLMKVAICGSGVSAIELAFNFYSLGVDFKLISDRPLGGKIRELFKIFPDALLAKSVNDLITPWSKKIIGNEDLGIGSVKNLWKNTHLNFLVL